MILSPQEKMRRLITNHRSALMSIQIDFAENYRKLIDMIEQEERTKDTLKKNDNSSENKLPGLCTPSRTEEAGSQGVNSHSVEDFGA
jgi:hypothetical protein